MGFPPRAEVRRTLESDIFFYPPLCVSSRAVRIFAVLPQHYATTRPLPSRRDDPTHSYATTHALATLRAHATRTHDTRTRITHAHDTRAHVTPARIARTHTRTHTRDATRRDARRDDRPSL